MMRLVQASIGYHQSMPILQGIDMELPSSQLVALVGRNGSGKSTLLRTMAGLQPLLAGSIIGERPAIVLTATPDLQHTTVRQMAAYGRLPYTGFLGKLHPSDYEQADLALATLGIGHMAQQLFCQLSDGERQKVMIARALTQGATTLLLDEPSAFLDYPSRLQLMELLRDLAHTQGKSILISTHDLELTQKYADQFWLIRDRHLFTSSATDSIDIMGEISK